MDRELHLTLRSTRGCDIPVVINSMASVRDLLLLCFDKKDSDLSYPFLIHNKRLLDLYFTLESQGVEDGDHIVIHDTGKSNNEDLISEDEDMSIEASSYDDKIIEIFREFLRIQDTYFDHLDANGKAQILYHRFIRENPRPKTPVYETIIPENPHLSTDFLPMCMPRENACSGCNPCDLLPSFFFKSIEDAGKYFAQKTSGAWNW